MNVIWHDLECGAYSIDLALWRRLADEHGDPVLDVGAGTGRVAIDLAARGHAVVALDHDPTLLAELSRRAEGLPIETVSADARAFSLGRRFPLCLVPMQTIQLLGGRAGRQAFLRCAVAHLQPDGVLAMAIADDLEPYETSPDTPGPAPDVRKLDGVVYASHPTALREDDDGFVLERRRETITAGGSRSVQDNRIRLDRLGPAQLEREARAFGLLPLARRHVPATEDYVGSLAVILGA